MLPLRALPLFRIGRTAVRVDPSLPLALAYLAWWLGERYGVVARTGAANGLLPGPVWAALVAAGALVGLVVHDLVRVGVTRFLGGRVREITLGILGARIALRPTRAASHIELRAALAAPLTSLALGFGLLALVEIAGPSAPDAHLASRDLARALIALGVLNLVPAFPLDGGQALRALVARRRGVLAATALVSSLGRVLAVGCVTAAMVRHDLPLLFVAVYLYAGAWAGERGEELVAPLAGLRARDAVLPPGPLASVHDRLADAAMLLARGDVAAVPVLSTDGLVLAAVGIEDIRRVPPAERWSTTVGDRLGVLGGLVRDHAALGAVRLQLVRRQAGAAAVVDHAGALVGVLTIDSIDRRVAQAEILTAERPAVRVPPPPPSAVEAQPPAAS